MKCEHMSRWAFTILVLGLITLPSQVGADDGWFHEFDQAAAAATREGKDILINFSGTDWCRPCKQLWGHTLSRPNFVELASPHFVLLDIDNLVREPMPEGRKERYDALQKRYRIHAFPTVVLATPDGSPYASSGMLEEINNPRAYWKHLEPLYERGHKFKAALKAAGGRTGLRTAETIVAALSEVRPDFVPQFYPDKIDQLRKLTPADETGYLAFLDTRTALLALEDNLYDAFDEAFSKWSDGELNRSRWIEAFAPEDVDALIHKHRPQGAALQEALLARAFLEIDAGQWPQALSTIEEIENIGAAPSRFERANFMQISIPSREDLRDHIRAARQVSDDPMAQLRVLYGIVRNDLECLTSTACCNHSFTPQLHQLVAGAAYGDLLLDSTSHLEGEARAAAIGKGLEGIDLFRNGSIGWIVDELMPELVGKQAAVEYLPPRYADWLRD